MGGEVKEKIKKASEIVPGKNQNIMAKMGERLLDSKSVLPPKIVGSEATTGFFPDIKKK